MGKKKSNPGQNHPSNSFSDTVAQAVNQKLLDTIDMQMKRMAISITNNINSSLEDIYARLSTLEDLALEKFNMTKEEFAFLVADKEDAANGLESADSVIKGDVVRIEVQTKTVDQAEFQGNSNHKVSDIGSGRTLGLEIENQIIGMSKDEVKEIVFGEKEEFIAQIKVHKISRIKGKVNEIKND